MAQFKIFGSEPAAIVAGVETLLAVALSFGLFGLTNDQAGGIVAVVSATLGLVVAYATRRTLLSATTGVVKALLMATATFGFALNDTQQAAILSAVAVVGGILLRRSNVSVDTPISNPSRGEHLAA